VALGGPIELRPSQALSVLQQRPSNHRAQFPWRISEFLVADVAPFLPPTDLSEKSVYSSGFPDQKASITVLARFPQLRYLSEGCLGCPDPWLQYGMRNVG